MEADNVGAQRHRLRHVGRRKRQGRSMSLVFAVSSLKERRLIQRLEVMIVLQKRS